VSARFLLPAAVLLCAALAGCASSAERQAEQEKLNKRAETHVLLGSGYMQRGQLEVAKQELDKAYGLAPDNSQVNSMMALLQWRLNNPDEAARHFRKAVAAEPPNPEAWNNYGVFLCERGKIDEALTWFQKAAANAFYSTPEEANLNAGVCLMKKPAPTVAEKYFREALRINPRLPGALYQMAKISLDSGQALPARGFIERYYQAAEDSPESLLLAVKIERALRNKNAEASYALRLRGKFPTSPEAGQLQTLSGARKK
jgi:type IV pilus assembly protein PilF